MKQKLCTTIELQKRYYPAQCNACKHKDCSCNFHGGENAGGDGDIICPKCHSGDVSEISNQTKV